MSAFLLGTGFRADMGTCIRKLVLLKLIDACEDDGSRIFPAIATVARAAQCSERQVQREIRAFLDVGLLTLVREGGKGRRSTNEYALDLDVLAAISRDGWDAYAGGRGCNSKGDTQSPLDEGAKGDTGDADRVTPASPKGDTWSRTTPPDSSSDPSERAQPREREDEIEDRKKIEAAYFRLVKDWPGQRGLPKDGWLKAFMALTPDERAMAERRYPAWVALVKAQGWRNIPAPSKYFGEKLFADVPDAPLEPEKPTVAPPFGPDWMAGRFVKLLDGPERLAHAGMLTAFERAQVAQGLADEAALLRQKQARTGFTAVTVMDDLAARYRGVPSDTVMRTLAGMMEPVPVDSAVFADWRAEHHRQGWPWIPDPGQQRVVFFPAGGPAGLSAFEAAVNEAKGDDGGEREAAE